MNLYLRFTTDHEDDAQRGTSYHDIGFYKGEDVEIDARYAAGRDENGKEIILMDDRYISVIGGLCGYLMEAETLEDAIEEAKAGNYPYGSIGFDAWVIFEGEDPRIQNVFGDGDIFRPIRVLHVATK